MTHPPGGNPSPDERLAALEAAMSQLIARVSRIEAALARDRGDPVAVTPAAAPPPPTMTASRAEPSAPPPARVAPSWRSLDLEQLVGRYGAIGFALLALLAGVGTFVSWAARQGLLGPELRVIGGYLIGAALAVAGLRLREARRTFANALLACALACVHAASWGAGPQLHLVPSGVALAIVAAASAALAWLAIREDEDVLFLFGVGGAAVAPFVLSDGSGGAMTLALYGVLVYLAAARGVGARPWHTSVRLVLWTVSAYLVALTAMGDERLLPVAAAVPTLAAGLWAAALLAHPMHAPRFARWGALALLAAALDLRVLGPSHGGIAVALAIVATVGAQLLFRRADHAPRDGLGAPASVPLLPVLPALTLDRALVDTVLLPLAGLVVVTAATPPSWLAALDAGARSPAAGAAGWGVIWALGAALLAVRDARRGTADSLWPLTATLALGLGAAGLSTHSILGAVSHALASALALGGWARAGGPRRAVEGAAGLLSVAAFMSAAELWSLSARSTYAPPFSTRTTLLAALTLGGALALRAIVRPRDGSIARGIAIGAGLFAFGWGLAELRTAWSRDLSNALLTLYVGVAGAVAIRVGQALREELLRRAGLALGAWCAIRTFVLAGDVESLPLRVGLYFLAAGIGLAMAWMYTGRRGK